MGWDWGRPMDKPIIRLSMEPIGPTAGFPSDPHNEKAANQLVYQLSQIFPDMDLSWYRHLYAQLLPRNESIAEQRETFRKQGHKSRVFIGFDLGQDHVTTKAYFFPLRKAVRTGQSSLAAITSALESLPSNPQFPAYAVVQDYLAKTHEGSKLEAEMVAIDCVAPAKSRVKIYFRSASTNILSVRSNMTLDGQVTPTGTRRGLLELERLWDLVFGKEREIDRSADLRRSDHRTSGILYYYELRPGQELPSAKVYLPVRHYGKSDKAVSTALTTFLEGRGDVWQPAAYIQALKTTKSVIVQSLHLYTALIRE
ncbi:MAG: hypothetical protein Q9222_003006 [Ikaeria aurantiellina]